MKKTCENWVNQDFVKKKQADIFPVMSSFRRGSFTLRLIIGRMVFQRMSCARHRPWEFPDLLRGHF
jgi:hypothetical protein